MQPFLAVLLVADQVVLFQLKDDERVALANDVFTPSEDAVNEAREILAAMEEAQKSGAGAAVYKGRLVDIASVRQAEVIVRQADMIAASN